LGTTQKQETAVIELDGSIHDKTEEYDEFRNTEMKLLGINILRLKNDTLSDMSKTLQRIRSFLDSIN
jgi:very-short-patch-repair endonuclease